MDGTVPCPPTAPHHACSATAPPDRVLVMGDLHIGAGSRAGEAADPLEHFDLDDAFEQLLQRVLRGASRRGLHYALVLNGDVFDFVRTVRLPESAAELAAWRSLLQHAAVRAPAPELEAAARAGFSAFERRYGLDAGEAESAWKLLAMADGHPRVFAALAQWCNAGHELVLVRGNHDVEWAWPGVRRAFRALLQQHGGTPAAAGRVRFRMHYYRRLNLHVEHGHAIRWSTFVRGRLTHRGGRALRQPFGSFINRFVLNPVERLALRSPGVSASSHLKHQLRHERLRLWRGLLRHAFRAMPPLGRATWRIWHRQAHGWWPTRVGIALAALLLLSPLLAPALLDALPLRSVPTRMAAALLVLATPHLGLAFLETLAHVRDDTRRRARAHVQRIVNGRRHGAAATRIVVLGHTHRPELARWEVAGASVVYANAGCWLPEHEQATGLPRLVWCARQGDGYGRTRVLEFRGGAGCRTRFRG